MSYTEKNFKTKKELKEAVAKYLDNHDGVKSSFGGIRCYNPGVGPDLSNFTGRVYLEGPHYPQPHRWYAKAELVDGIVIKVS